MEIGVLLALLAAMFAAIALAGWCGAVLHARWRRAADRRRYRRREN